MVAFWSRLESSTLLVSSECDLRRSVVDVADDSDAALSNTLRNQRSRNADVSPSAFGAEIQ